MQNIREGKNMMRRDCLRTEITDRWRINNAYTGAGCMDDGFYDNKEWAARKCGRRYKASDRSGIMFGMKR